jgi:hypothetical protein
MSSWWKYHLKPIPKKIYFAALAAYGAGAKERSTKMLSRVHTPHNTGLSSILDLMDTV